uniref:Putative capsid protein n=1 Tax=viral metagenome TaxID=1070528 RepID=A0A6M3INS5_9ZZZZ
MPPLTKSDVHTSAILTNFLLRHPPSEFIAHRVFPVVPVSKEADTFYKWYAGHRIIKDSRRAPGDDSKKVELGLTTDTYQAYEYALHDDVPLRVARDADRPLDIYEEAAWNVREMVLLDIERVVQALAQASGNNKASPAATWDNATLSNAKPHKDVEDARETMRARTGLVPNCVVMSAAVASALKIWLMDQKNGGGVEFATMEQYLRTDRLPPRLWDMELLIGGGIKSSAERPEDVAAANLSDVWNDNVVLLYKAPRPAMKTLAAGYTFQVTKSTKARRGTYDGPRESDWVEFCTTEAHKVTSSDCIQMIENVLE